MSNPRPDQSGLAAGRSMNSNPTPNLAGLARTAEARKRRTAERDEAICDLFLAGVTIPALARQFSVSTRTIECRLVANDLRTVSATKPRMTAEECEKARRMLEDGQSYYAVGEVLGRAQQTIERNVPGYAKLSPQESGQRAALVRQLGRMK